MTCSTQLRTNGWLRLDHFLGLSGSGLIVYGALPASLSALGVVKLPDQAVLPLSLPSVPFVVVVALAPVVLTFVLTKQRMAAWYLLGNYLLVRSLVVTLGIVVASTAVCLAARAVTKPDIGAAMREWLALPFANEANTVGHALLISLAFLVGSSTLFLTVIKEDGGLPLLPTKDRLAKESELRRHLIDTIAAAKVWPVETEDGTLQKRSTELTTTIEAAEKTIVDLKKWPQDLGRAKLYEQITEEFSALKTAIADVCGSKAAYAKYWSETPPGGLNKDETRLRTLIRRHAELSVHV
jgi:hypothetical protein